MSKFSFMVSGSVILQWIEQKLNCKNTGCLFICFCSFRHVLAELLGHLEVLVMSRIPSSSKHQDYIGAIKN